MAVSIQASAAGLKIVDQARRNKGWTKKAAAWCDAGKISTSTLDRFWARQSIQQENFVAICKAVGINNWAEIAEESFTESQFSRSFSFSAYNKATWVGREEILSTLGNQLQENVRLLLISGFTGIGKTALAERLAEDTIQAGHLRLEFHRVSFDIEGQSQDFTTGAAAILAELGEPELDPQERNNPQRLSDRLLQKLQNKPYWIQLDALERLLPNESAEFFDSHWLSFVQRCLNSSDFPSRLVLTTQTSPAGFEEFVDRYPTLWHEKTLQGLSASERLELFARNGIEIDETNRATLDRIGQIYEGHPLVLQVIAREILARPFNGNVAQYWERYGNEFEQVARELQQSQRVNPALYSRELQKRVRQRVEKSLKRLPTDALDLLCRASVYRRPVPETFWWALIDDRSPIQQQEAYGVLGDRALVEQEGIHQGQFFIRQHNLIRDIAYDVLRQDLTIWKNVERKAAYQWLINYQPVPSAINLEKARGYLEAFYHYYEVEDWQRAMEILIEQGIGPLLQIWGYYKEMGLLYAQLLNRLDDSINMICLKGLGNASSLLSDYQEGLKFYKKSLEIAYRIKNREEEGNLLNNLGVIYKNLGRYHMAIEIYRKSLVISRKTQSREEERRILNNLGNAFLDLNEHNQAIKCYEQSLTIANELDDIHGRSMTLGNLGIVYHSIGDFEQSINYQLQHLAISKKIGDRQGEGRALGRLGNVYISLKNYSKAVEYLNDGLLVLREIGDRTAEAQTYKSLAELHQKTGSIDQARQYCDRALGLAIELGIPLVKECEELKQQLEEEHSGGNS